MGASVGRHELGAARRKGKTSGTWRLCLSFSILYSQSTSAMPECRHTGNIYPVNERMSSTEAGAPGSAAHSIRLTGGSFYYYIMVMAMDHQGA